MMKATTPASIPQPADELRPTAKPSSTGSVRVHGESDMRTAYPIGYITD